MVSQNDPFLPMFNAWINDSRDIPLMDDNEARLQVGQICAKVLSNRKPPYAICGGLYDAVKDSGGNILSASNFAAESASMLFEQLEGIDIHPAAAIATATLIKEAESGNLPKDATIMLNITGGGEKRFRQDKQQYYLKPAYIFGIAPTIEEIKEYIL